MNEATRIFKALLNQPLPELVWEACCNALEEIEEEDRRKLIEAYEDFGEGDDHGLVIM